MVIETKKEKKRREQHERIFQRYEELRQEEGNTNNRICELIASETGFSRVWVLTLIKKKGIYREQRKV